MIRNVRPWLLVSLLAACARPAPAPAPPPRGPVTLTLVGTNDLHGFVLDKDGAGGLPLLAGYLANLRAGGRPVLLVDGGDAFQGTLESNLNEGKMVVDCYARLGYDAMAVGNHELDFGPVGPDVAPRKPGDDPRGALKARIAEARFPILSANLVDEAGVPVAGTSTIVDRGGVRIGIVGLTTEETPQSTLAANFRGLHMLSLADTASAEAARLRAAGAEVVIVTVHAGAKCGDPAIEATCAGELVDAAPRIHGVDAIIAGHTHAPVATRLSGIPTIESYSYGRAFGRIDLTVDSGRVTAAKIYPTEDVRAGATYEGKPVVADAAVAAMIRPYADTARARREERLGVRVPVRIRKAYDLESPLGNVFVDLMQATRPGVDGAMSNGGALRTDLPAGDLTYGVLFEMFPFDNMVAEVKLTGADVRRIVQINLESGKSILSLAGLRARARCGTGLEIALARPDGRPVRDDEVLTIVTSDFLATGGNDGAFKVLPAGAVTVEDGVLVREEIARLLRARGGELRGDDDTGKPRLAYPGTRPVRCP
jgi:5'-nucleotidase